jgi:transposase
MQDRELYKQILDIRYPWEVIDVELNRPGREVRVKVEWNPTEGHKCPECGIICAQHDRRERSWRHLDTCQYRTILTADIPRVKCEKHGVLQVKVPWAEPGSRFTALFERLAIDWLQEASISAVAEQLGMSWDEVDGIMQRAVQRGLERREQQTPRRVGIDETSYQKHHEYVTVLNDLERAVVIDVLDDRTQETLEKGLKSLGSEALAKIESVALDMWQPYIAALQNTLKDAEGKMAFDRFHVAKHIGDAVNKVRGQEHRAFYEQGESPLTKSKYLWLHAADNLEADEAAKLEHLCRCARKTARAWSLKELARTLWCYSTKGWARRAWLRWYSKAIRSRLEPIKKVARMIKEHIEGIINAAVMRVTNSGSEALNARIQWLKKSACGFRNRRRFRNAILFHFGGLNLYPKHEIAV